MVYTRASASDYDDWEKLGNPGWGSKELMELSRKARSSSASWIILTSSCSSRHTIPWLVNRKLTGQAAPSMSLEVASTRTLDKTFLKRLRNTTRGGPSYEM